MMPVSSGLKWRCWKADSLYKVRRRAWLWEGRIGQSELRSEEEIVWATRKSLYKEAKRRVVGGIHNPEHQQYYCIVWCRKHVAQSCG
jgi:hypothetical protein